VDCNDAPASVVSLLRKGSDERDTLLVVCNFTPVPRLGYLVGVPSDGYWKELLNSDAREYGGSGMGNMGGTEALPFGSHGRPYSLRLTLPPLGALFLKKS
jgi:1,4-alpha-glucan branching enzyme